MVFIGEGKITEILARLSHLGRAGALKSARGRLVAAYTTHAFPQGLRIALRLMTFADSIP